MFLGINMFLALLRANFNPCYARAKMILSRAKNIFMPANVNSIVILTSQFLNIIAFVYKQFVNKPLLTVFDVDPSMTETIFNKLYSPMRSRKLHICNMFANILLQQQSLAISGCVRMACETSLLQVIKLLNCCLHTCCKLCCSIGCNKSAYDKLQ